MQHGVNYAEEIPLFTLSGFKAAPTLVVSEQWLQRLEKQYQAEASASSKAPSESGSSCDLASGDAVVSWLFDWEPNLPCTPTLPGRYQLKFAEKTNILSLPEDAPCLECIKGPS